MKTIKYILGIVVISAALFAGCKKQNDMQANPITTANEIISGPAATVNYQLQLLLPPAGLVNWQEGRLSEGKLFFDGTHVFGDMLRRFEYEANEMKTVNLFGTNDLGSITVPAMFYRSASFKIELAARDGISALELSGVHTTLHDPVMRIIPIKFVTYESLMLQSDWINTVTINASANYSAMLTLDMSQLTNGITNEMLEGATEDGDVIYITSISNTALYNMMIGNIRNAMLDAGFTMLNSPTVSSPDK